MRALMTIRRLVLGTLGAVTLGACSLAPNYERPPAPIPANWPDQPKIAYTGYNKAATTDLEPVPVSTAVDQVDTANIGWRDFFLDPRLRALVSLALANNRNLAVAIQRVEAAHAQWQQQRGGLLPSVGVGAQGSIESLPPGLRKGSDSPAITSTYQGGLALTSFEFDLFGRLRNLSEMAYQQLLATEQTYRSVQISLVGEVAQAYLNLRAAEVQLTLTRQVLEQQQASYNLVLHRFNGGIASELDVEQAKSVLASASSSLADIARTQSQARNALVLLLGTSLPEDLPPPSQFSMKEVLAVVPADLPSTLLIRRPDILSAEHALQAAHANIGAARAAFFPTISLTGMYGVASTSLSGLWSGSNNGFWSYAPSVAVPIFAGGTLKAGVDAAHAQRRIALAQYEYAIQQAFSEVANALAGETTYAGQLKTLDDLTASLSRTLALSNVRYTGGIDSYLQVQTAQIAAFNSQLSLVQTTLASLVNRVQLYKALGGGWEETTIPQS